MGKHTSSQSLCPVCSPDTAHHIAHCDQQARPFFCCKLGNRLHYSLSKAHNQYAVVRLMSPTSESFVSCDQQSLFSLSHLPKNIVSYTLVYRAANVQHTVPCVT
jgi:hypothetical protein